MLNNPSTEREKIVFSANATCGVGGQGEFLRQMVHALATIPGTRVFSRGARSDGTTCIDIPFSRKRYRRLFELLSAIPLVRGRADLLTLLSDLEFDSRVASDTGTFDLFDGIAGQCATALAEHRARRAVRVVTSLNSHVNYLAATLEQEYRSLGVPGQHFIHPRMRARMLREIDLADTIRVPSTFSKSTFVEAGVPPEKVVILPLSIDLHHFQPVTKPDSVFRVLAVSTIDPRKGIVHLLRAYEGLNIPNSELMLIGSTGSRWARRMLSRFVSRIPSLRNIEIDVTRQPVVHSYGMASVFVHSAIEDGFGLVIPQAMACGVPVIATRQSGASELIVHGYNGFVVEARQPDQIREYMRLLAADQGLRETMGLRARASVQEHGYEGFARRVRHLYHGLLAGRKA